MQRLILLITIFVYLVLAEERCSYLADDGSFYDLSPLRSTADFITSYDHQVFYFSICRDAYTCTGGGACARTSLGDETTLGYFDFHTFSQKHVKDGQGVSLVYNGGTDCKDIVGAGEFVITLKCDETEEFLLSSEFNSECSESRAVIYSRHACPIYIEANHSRFNGRSQEVVENETNGNVSDTKLDFHLLYLSGALVCAIITLLLIMVVAIIIYILPKRRIEYAIVSQNESSIV